MLAALLVPLAAGVSPDYLSCNKFELIESERLRPGTRVSLSARELTAWAEEQVPPGVRSPRLELGEGSASGSALIDRKSTRLNSSHIQKSRMPSSA